VVITGVGAVSPFGPGGDALDRLFLGESRVRPIESFDTSRYRSHLGAEVSDFVPKDFIAGKNLRKMDRISRMAVAASRMAVDDAKLLIDETNRERVGIILGVSFGSVDISVQIAHTLFTEGPQMVNPILVPNTVLNAPAGHTSIELGFIGINSTVNHKEASAETAIAYGAAEIMRGTADVVLAGGTEAIAELLFAVLLGYRALSPTDGKIEGIRPFDEKRNGAVLGEGAGIVCLEALEHAQKRGRDPYAEVLGWGMSSAPSPPNDWPDDPKGPILAMERAISSSGLSPSDIDYISASANGTDGLDRIEAEAIAHVFGEGGQGPFVSSIKGAVGESYSSGGIRGVALARSFSKDTIPPTVGLNEPAFPLNFVTGNAKETKIERALLNGFSSGGTFISLVFGKYS
jgi:3-oxoacyl-[acyl-carrier-protein] synthase II